MEKIYLLIFFIVGSVMGSFYYVVATRLSKGESIVKPASHCDKCGHVLKWYENIHRNSGYRQEMYDYAKENLQFHELVSQIRDKLNQG